MSTQQDINAFRAQRIANTHDPLALMANTQTPCHPDHSSLITYIQHPQPNNNFVPQPSFNTNYMPQPMQNLEDSSDPTNAMNKALALLAKAFKCCSESAISMGMECCYSSAEGKGTGNNGKGMLLIFSKQLQIAQEDKKRGSKHSEECEFMLLQIAYEETERSKSELHFRDTLIKHPYLELSPDNAPSMTHMDQLRHVVMDPVMQRSMEFIEVSGRITEERRCYYAQGKENVVTNALSRKERVKLKHVRAMAMIIQYGLKAARDRQKSYVDNRRKPLKFEVGDRVMLKVSPWKGVLRFGKKGKLAPSLHVSLDEIKVNKTLRFVEEPVDNSDREVKRFDNQSIERDRLFGIGFVLDFVEFISFTFSGKEMILVIEAVLR
ncbi:hypothetical protein Tco_0794767 [Tanacetum coccineum]